MILNIKDPEAARLALAIARATGETLSAAVIRSLRERLERVRRARGQPLREELLKIGRRCASLPRRDQRRDAEITRYDEHGLPR
ncbi:MAG TPA: type II toxin-antitoxin system VapB family antitoxin [Gammaproteobacteria bacterium]|nr:type II toxin-antitoxin system VapB family antitoxin [Gammaproteobacteria bacterium]